MKYQVIKHNKSGTRQLAVYESLESAKLLLAGKLNAHYKGLSYIGQFPLYKDFTKGLTYSIQGWTLVGGTPVVCSLSAADTLSFTPEMSYWACASCGKVQPSTAVKTPNALGKDVCFPTCK